MIFNIIKNKLSELKKRLKNWFLKPSFILYYHRIEKVHEDPHLLSVSPENFEKQLLFLKKKFKIITLRELTQSLQKQIVPRGSVVITFDDGYADNLINALPILKKLKIPATIFVVAGKIGSNEPFYWDEKTEKKDQGRSMTEGELKELSNNPLIEIGAHTMTHPHIANLSIEKQKYEIEESKKILESTTGKPVAYFSYPFGGVEDFNKDTIDILKQNNFEVACTTIRENIKKTSYLLALPRKIVRNWDLKDFKKNI